MIVPVPSLGQDDRETIATVLFQPFEKIDAILLQW